MINGLILRDAIISGANIITSQRSTIDDLNIFPVPDGDTGTNMSMTINAAAKELEKSDDTNIGAVAKLAASAMLRGARGNSGVILSLLFRGFAKGLEGKEEADGKDLAEALGIGVEAAYGAVMKPTEGTILTVAREGYESGIKAATINPDVIHVWQVIIDAAEQSLLETPELLPVLKKAGVVDAGGKGFCVIFNGMMSVLRDGEIIKFTETNKSAETNDLFKSAAAEFDSDINFTYCTEFIVAIENTEKESKDLREYLESIGDCVVVVDDEEIIKVHVHTEDPGNALQAGLAYGPLQTVKIENMKEQHKNASNKSETDETTAANKKPPQLIPHDPTSEVGFVAVSTGAGLEALFKDLGCNHVVSGGQSMNPSTEDIYEAVMATGAKTVFVLPNNKNIIMAAEQVVPLVKDRTVIVLHTKTVPQGLSAMLYYDPDVSPNGNKQLMTDAATAVSTGQVTFAARDSEFGGTKIKEGDIIALLNGKLTMTDKDPSKAVYKLAKTMVTKESTFMTLIYGNDISEEVATATFKQLQAKFGNNIDITLINGGQPIYYYFLSVE